MPTERRVTIDLQPIYWRGSPLLTWMAAVVAWAWVILLAVLVIVGAA